MKRIAIIFLLTMLTSTGIFSQNIHSILSETPVSTDSLSLEYTDYTFQLVFGGADSLVTINFSKPVFSDSALAWLNDSVYTVTNRGTASDTIYSSPLSMADEIIIDCLTLRADFPDYFIPWVLNRTTTIITARIPVISMKYEAFSFTGGAHPSTETLFMNFDIRKQQQITLSEVIDPDKLNEFYALAEKRFREVRELEHSGSLNAAGFWFENDVFSLSPFYAFTDQGLWIHYNQYQIAPYSYGSTDLIFTAMEILSYISPNYLFMTNQR